MALVLIIEDALFTRRVIGKILQTAGYETIEAINGQQGLEIACERTDIDCIMLDMLMPELDGWGVLNGLRDKGLQIPVIVMTADIQESTRQKCLELGAAIVLNKPPSRNEVIDTLKTVLSDKQETPK